MHENSVIPVHSLYKIHSKNRRKSPTYNTCTAIFETEIFQNFNPFFSLPALHWDNLRVAPEKAEIHKGRRRDLIIEKTRLIIFYENF